MRYTTTHHKTLAAGRLLLVVGAVLALIGGITYAALQAQHAKLTGNTIQTATAALQLSQDGTTFASSLPGYTFSDVIPGGPAVPANAPTITLKNVGSAPLMLKFYVATAPNNPDNVDLGKVHIILTPISGAAVQNFTLAQLVQAGINGISLPSPSQLGPGLTAAFKLQVSMEGDATNASSATINNLEFSFGGTI